VCEAVLGPGLDVRGESLPRARVRGGPLPETVEALTVTPPRACARL